MATLCGTFEAGALIRKQVKREIEKYCAQNNIECSLQEFKYFAYSEFVMTLRGEELRLKSLNNWLQGLGDS